MTLGECEIGKTYLCSSSIRIEVAVKEIKENKTQTEATGQCGYSISVDSLLRKQFPKVHRSDSKSQNTVSTVNKLFLCIFCSRQISNM